MLTPVRVVADTVGFSSQLIGIEKDTMRIDILARNSLPVSQFDIPISWSSEAFNLDYLSISTSGHRTDYFNIAEAANVDSLNNRIALRLVSSTDRSLPDLPPDTGALVSIYFAVTGDPTGNTLTLTTQPYNIYQLSYTTDFGVYSPATLPSSNSPPCQYK